MSYYSVLFILLEKNEYLSLKSGKYNDPKWLIIIFLFNLKNFKTDLPKVFIENIHSCQNLGVKVTDEEFG